MAAPKITAPAFAFAKFPTSWQVRRGEEVLALGLTEDEARAGAEAINAGRPWSPPEPPFARPYQGSAGERRQLGKTDYFALAADIALAGSPRAAA